MTYTQQLKNEIELYLKNLDRYEEVSPKALEALSKAAAKAKEKREQGIHKTEQSIEENAALRSRIRELPEELSEAARSVRYSVAEYIDYILAVLAYRSKKKRQEKLDSQKDKIAENEKQTQERYAKLLAIRQEYADKFAAISSDPKEVEKSLSDTAAQLENVLAKQKADKTNCQLLPLLEGEDKKAVDLLFDILPLVFIQRSVLKKEKYPNLLRLYALFTRRGEAASCAPDLEEGPVSVVCADAFMKLKAFIAMENNDLRKGLWKSAFIVQPLQGFEIMFFANGEHSADLPRAGNSWDNEILLMERGKLKDILKAIEEQPNADLPELVLRLSDLREPDAPSENAEDGFADIISRLAKPKNPKQEKFMKDFTEFTRLYRETPEERLVTEQRYYQQKLLEQAEEKNRLIQQQIYDDQERQEEEERYRWEMERRERKEREEREREMEWEQKRRKREEERQQWEAKEQAQRDERMRQHAENFETRRQCRACANYGHCQMAGRRPNCPSFRPR